MTNKLDDRALDRLFRAARTRNGWTEQPVTERQLRELDDLTKFGPTSGNCCPARFVWVTSVQGKSRLAALTAPTNAPKILTAPVTVIVGYDLDFAEQLPKLFPARGKDTQAYYSDPLVAQSTAFRNSSLQGAYLIIAARALGLDCGPMSGFSNEAVDSEFFANTRIKSNFICSIVFVNPYYAITYERKRLEYSARFHYLWNSTNNDPFVGFGIRNMQPGQAFHVNYATSYELWKNVRLGFNGYWLQQLTDHQINGSDVSNSRERTVGLGPGIQLGGREIWFRLNGYMETDVHNRPSGIKVTFRISKAVPAKEPQR